MYITMKKFLSTKQIVVEASFGESYNTKKPTFRQPAQGILYKIDQYHVGLFVADRKLYLFLNGTVSEVRAQQVSASIHVEGENGRLSITIGQSVKSFVYKNLEKPISTQFYSEDDEDNDFGIWLVNVLSSEERQRIFIQSWISLST